MSLFRRAKVFLFGAPRNLFDPRVFHQISLIAFFAWVGLGADGISSSAYGPEEAYLALGGHTVLALFVAVATVITVSVISGSYSQIIEAFPSGGGGYIVASKLLGERAGVVSGAALVIDYVLTVTISVAAGVNAVFSVLPAEWGGYRFLSIGLVILVLVWLNLRGVKESVLVLTPIFLAFLLSHVPLILYAVIRHLADVPLLASRVSQDLSSSVSDIGGLGVALLLIRAYSMGAGTYTGIEAVSNSMQTLREPRVHTGKKAMFYMAVSLSFIAGGIILGYVLNDVRPAAGKTLNAVLFEGLAKELAGERGAEMLLAFVMGTEAVLLFVAAQTGFLGGPQVLANMAVDSYMPRRFAHLSDRLVTKYGVYFMGAMAFLMLYITGGSVQYLVIMYSINVFVTFTLSQFGMCIHWIRNRKDVGGWKRRTSVNGVGFVLTASILCITVWIKFPEGGWVTLLITGAFAALSFLTRRHYRLAQEYMRRLDDLLTEIPSRPAAPPETPVRRDAPTAAILVSGYNGLGMHVLFSVVRLFPGLFRNFVFLSVGVLDSSRFKGADEVENLAHDVSSQLAKYVSFARARGYHAEARCEVGTDVVDVVARLAASTAHDYPNTTFFAGKLVFREENFLTRLLHNQTAFLAQRRVVFLGFPMFVLPIRAM